MPIPISAAIGLAGALAFGLGVLSARLRGLVDWLDGVGLALQAISLFGLLSLILWAWQTADFTNPSVIALQVGLLLLGLVAHVLRVSRRSRLKQKL